MLPNILISVFDASKYSGISISDYFKLIRKGYIKTNSPIPIKIEDDNIELASKIKISLSYLKPGFQLNYILDLFKDNQLNVNLMNLYQNDLNKYNDFLSSIQAIKEYFERDTNYYIDDRSLLSKYFLDHYDITIKDLYAVAERLSLEGYRFLYKKKRNKDYYNICPCARDFINSEIYYFQRNRNIDIFNNLVNEKNILGKDFCKDCPHNPSNILFHLFLQETKQNFPGESFMACLCKKKEGLIIPKEVSSISHFKTNSNRSLLYLVKHGQDSWLLKYGHMINNDVPDKLNYIFYIDCHELPCYVYLYDDIDGNHVYKKPWVIIVLEARRKVIAGSTFCLGINSYLASQALASAIAFKTNSPVCGSCKYLYSDNGHEFKNKTLVISSKTKEIIKKDEDSSYYFYPENLCTALGIEHIFFSPYSPRQNDLERTNKTIDEIFYSNLKDCFVNKKKNTYDKDLVQEIENLSKSNDISTFEKAQAYWHNYVVPTFNNTIQKGSDISRIDGYIEDVKNGLRNDSIFPSGSVLSVSLKQKQKVTVKNSHIIFNKQNYESDKLSDDYNGNLVAYGFEENVGNDGIFVFENKGLDFRYIGMAFPTERISQNETNKLKLKRNVAVRYKQLSDKYNNIEFIKFMHIETGFHNTLMSDYDEENNIVIPYASRPKIAQDNEFLVNLRNIQCDIAYNDELKCILKQRELAIHTELIKQLIQALLSYINTKE